MGTTKERTVHDQLARAAAIGQQIEAIMGDIGLQRLSKAAWLDMAAELADDADLVAIQEKIAALPYLANLIERTAHRWRDDGQDRPVVDGIFANGHNELAAYAERLSAGLTVEQASAVLAARVAELHQEGYWGRLSSFDEIVSMLNPLYEELGALDRQLQVDLRARDIVWSGGRGMLRAGGVSIVLDDSVVGRVASDLARAVRDVARGLGHAA